MLGVYSIHGHYIMLARHALNLHIKVSTCGKYVSPTPFYIPPTSNRHQHVDIHIQEITFWRRYKKEMHLGGLLF